MRLIDADAILPIMETKMDMQDLYLPIHFQEMIIDEMPTVDAEPVRHGEWVKMRGMMPSEYMGLKECSVCGWHIHPLGRTAFDLKESEFRYCPRCGARLDRERKDDGND